MAGGISLAFSIGMSLRAASISTAKLVDETTVLLQQEPEIISKQMRPDYFASSQMLARTSMQQTALSLFAVAIPMIVIGLAYRAVSLLFTNSGERLLGAQGTGAAIAAAGVVGSLVVLISYGIRDIMRGAAALLIGSVGHVRLGAITGSLNDSSLIPTSAKLSARHSASAAALWADVAGSAAMCNMRVMGTIALVLAPVFINYLSA